LVHLLTCTANSSVRRISPSRSIQKALYRFLNNKKVEESILIDELCSRSSSLCQGRHILCIQDTTEMNFFSQKHRIKEDSGLGRLDGAKPTLGFKMHSVLMLDAQSSDLLGFADLKLWHRSENMPNRRLRKYQTLPIEQKESFKWIEAATKCKERLKDAASITFIEDREGDIFEQLSSISTENAHYIIRSKSNRKIAGNAKAWDVLKQQSILGSYSLSLQTDHRKQRLKKQVELKVRYAPITIEKTHYIKNGTSYPDAFTINIVEAYEEKADGISWRLLTTHSISSFNDAYQILEWYSQRWMIEQVHRLLKHKGFQIEDSELESGWAIRKLCVLMLSALIRIFQMNLAYGEPEGGQPLEEIFSKEEIECLGHLNDKLQGQTSKQRNNNDKAKLKWATWIIARLGGWKGYDSQGPPGIILLKRGLDKFCNIFFGWKLAQDVGTR
jgi:hypothetical protein